MLPPDRQEDAGPMQRFVLALIVLAVLVALGALALRAVGRALEARTGREVAPREEGAALPRVAFVLLLALTVYAAFVGAG